MTVVIVDYGMGNLGSIANMIKKVEGEAVIAADPAVVAGATKLIIPGVGAFDGGMRSLEERGLIPVLNERVLEARVPVLGLCLGAQLLGHSSEEGERPGLGWIDARTVRFHFSQAAEAPKVPHMGWNVARPGVTHPLFAGMPVDSRFYFVHSYHLVCDPANVLTTTEYGYEFASGIVRDNIVGLQFHPEKSHRFGMQLFRNFLALPA